MAETSRIRPMGVDDLALVLSWRNHPEIRRYMLTQHEICLDEHKIWFAKASQDKARQLLIVENGHLPLGYVQFSNVIAGGVADWGFYANPEAPKGTGKKLGTLALCHAFESLHLHKVCGQALDFNTASISFHQRFGFAQEGLLRDQYRIDGVYHSLICFGLLRREWQPN